jgi:hypothetical protein
MEHEYHGVELRRIPTRMLIELVEHYGPAGCRWFATSNKLYFREPRDHTYFLLRWGSW